MNFLEGEFDSGRFVSRSISLELTASQLGPLNKLQSRKIWLGVRPDHVQLTPSSRDDALSATVYVTELMGNETFVLVNIGENRLIVRAPAEFRAEEENAVWLSFANDKFHFYDHETELRIQTLT
jgi:ABC-type sugar transport system ATPase subunit